MSLSTQSESSPTASSVESFPITTPVDDAHTPSSETRTGVIATHNIQHDNPCLTNPELSTCHFKNEQRRDRLTLEDCIDMDVDMLTTVLERSFQTLKRDTLQFFVDARTRFKTRAISELNQERHEAERMQQTKKQEIHLLEQELKAEKQRSDGYMHSLNRMAEAVGSANLRKRRYRLLLTVFLSWIDYTKSEKQLKHKMQRAFRYYCDEYLSRRAMVQWIEYIREQHRTCARERFQSKVAIATAAIESQHKERIAALEEENAKLKERLSIEEEAKSKLEEDMQQAFMRGVCALNMEALNVLKRGIPGDGVNTYFMDSVSDKVLTSENETESLKMKKEEV